MEKSNLKKSILSFAMYFILPYILGFFLPAIGESTNLELILRTAIYIIIICVFIYSYKKDFKNNFKEINLRFFSQVILTAFILTISILLMNLIINMLFPNIQFSNHIIAIEYLKNSTWFMLFFLLIYSPIIENIVFRKSFLDVISNKWTFIFFSALVFGFYNIGYTFSNVKDLIILISYFTNGVIVAYSYHKSKNIYFPIFVQILYASLIISINLV